MPPQLTHQLAHAFYRSSLLDLCVSEWPPQVQAWGCFLRQALEMSPPPSFSPSLSHTYTRAHTHTLSLSPSLPPSLLLSLPPCVSWLESSSDSVHPTSGSETQTHSSRPSSLFMNQVQPKYVWAEDRWPAHRVWAHKGKHTESYLAPAPINTTAPAQQQPLTSIRVVDGFLPTGAFLMCSSWESALLDMTHDNLWKC